MKFRARTSALPLGLSLVFAVAAAVVSCRDTRSRSQEWVASAPEKAILGVSVHLGWALERPEIREAIAKYPIFEQTLEIFLDTVKMDATSETVRASFYLLKILDPDQESPRIDDLGGMALIQFAGFSDPKALQKTIVETFPPEGSLRMGGREYPLFAFFDINNVHLRVFIDGEDRLWIGDIAPLSDVAKGRLVGGGAPLSRAAEWIQPSGALQGFIQPELVPKSAIEGYAEAIPPGVKGLAWSISTLEKDPESVSLTLSATGTEEAVVLMKPWMHRLTAAASTLAGEGAPPPDAFHEKTRLGLKCQVRLEHLGRVLDTVRPDSPTAPGKGPAPSKQGAR